MTDLPPEPGTGTDLPEGWVWRSYHCLNSKDGNIFELEAIGPRRFLRSGRTWAEAKKAIIEAINSKGLII
jgi:hypothetical protein